MLRPPAGHRCPRSEVTHSYKNTKSTPDIAVRYRAQSLESTLQLRQLKIQNFQSFGPLATVIDLSDITVLIGTNGTGKTAALTALCRLFASDSKLRGVRKSDFHVANNGSVAQALFIEATFEFEADDVAESATIPDHFNHLRLLRPGQNACVRYRLMAEMANNGDAPVQELRYILDVSEDDEPTRSIRVPRHELSKVQIHYIPAKRNPAEHISFAQTSLLGRLLRAASWEAEREQVGGIAEELGRSVLAQNPGVEAVRTRLSDSWTMLHRGQYFTDPQVSFGGDSLEILLRYLSLAFSPGHNEERVDFTRLSDGQQSLLYLSLVLTAHRITKDSVGGDLAGFDLAKLRPATFSLVIMEEPENSLAPHYLGRIVKVLQEFCALGDAQAVVTTHAPSILKRVDPEKIRHFRLDHLRQTRVRSIKLPEKTDDAYKYVRQAVVAYPEVYFARLVVLGEGDSEEIVLPRLLRAVGLPGDDASIVVTPLGGRHVNHFWRLLGDLGIPYVTLLDLDSGRYGGGWGRVSNIAYQLIARGDAEPGLTKDVVKDLPKWSTPSYIGHDPNGQKWLRWLEENHRVFFCYPLDLDFAMLAAFPEAYAMDDTEDEEGASMTEPDEAARKAVLGKKGLIDAEIFSADELRLFGAYHSRFKLGSKPSSHLSALSVLDDADLSARSPASIRRLIGAVQTLSESLPE
ncbi:ATP-dependent nuclease [Pseudonocardia alni]|uniref:ATP-dependent nuclease n=1 Tax=Pseudonocardia alni TaxID=33907 RepID=UPI0033F2813D